MGHGDSTPTSAAGSRTAIASSLAVLGLAVVFAGCDLPTGLPRVESTFRFPVDDVVVPVTSIPATASSRTDLDGIDLTDRVQRAVIRITPDNPAGSTGQLTIRLTGGGVDVAGPIDVAGPPNQEIHLSGQEVRALMQGSVTIEASGTLCPAAGCSVGLPPFPEVTLKNELDLILELGGET